MTTYLVRTLFERKLSSNFANNIGGDWNVFIVFPHFLTYIY